MTNNIITCTSVSCLLFYNIILICTLVNLHLIDYIYISSQLQKKKKKLKKFIQHMEIIEI